MKYLGQISNDNDIVNKKKLDTELANKMDKSNPTGTGSLSINRKANTTVGTNSMAVGNNNEASGVYSTAIGINNIASGLASFAEGGEVSVPTSGNIASGTASHAGGIASTASGVGSNAFGNNVNASGIYSSANGHGTIAQRAYQKVFGEYNIADTTGANESAKGDYIEIVGNGTLNVASLTDVTLNRSNARTLDWNGNEELAGNIILKGGKLGDGKNATYKLVIPDTTSWTADRTIATTNDLENSNLLANGDFELNSKGQTVYGDPNNTTVQYPPSIETLDTWYFNRDYNGTFNADTKLLSVGSIGTFSILFSSTGLQANKYEGKTFTLSVNAVGDNSASLFYGIGYGDKTNEVNYTNIAQGGNKGTGTFVISATIPTNLADTKVIKVRLYKNAGSATINWAKLEFGSINTANIPTNHEKLINKVSSVDANSTNDQYASAKCVYDNLQTKQNTLVSGTNIKTINNESILGSGNITISGSSAVTSVNTKTGAVVLNPDDLDDTNTTNKFITSSDKENWVYFISGSSSAAGNSTADQYLSTKWEGTVSGITTPYNGMKISYRIATNTGVATAGAVLSIDGGTNYYPVVYNINSVIGTRYSVGSTIFAVFNSTQTADAYLTTNTKTTITGCWQIMDYDANSYAYMRMYNLATNADRDLLMRYDTGSITSGSYANKYGAIGSNLKANPSTGELKAVKFTENGVSLASKYVPGTRTIAGVDLADNVTKTELLTALNVTDGAEPNAVDSVNGATGTVVLDADDISDTTTTNKFVTSTEKSTWNGKQAGDTKLTSISGLSNSSTGLVKLTNGVASLDNTAYTTNTGTVTSVRVQAGTGLSSSTSTAQSTSLNTTISVASGYKLPTTTEWNNKADASGVIKTSNSGYQTIQNTSTSQSTVLTLSSNDTSYNSLIHFTTTSTEAGVKGAYFGLMNGKICVQYDGYVDFGHPIAEERASQTYASTGGFGLRSGLRIAWGTVSAAQPFTANFSGVSFTSSTSYQVILSPLYNSNSGSGGFWVKSKSTTSFSGTATPGFGTIQYIAIGY